MSSYNCPFCGITLPVTDDTHQVNYPSFSNGTGHGYSINGAYTTNDCISIDMYKCPECKNISVIASSLGKGFKKPFRVLVNPTSSAKQYPDYIPKAIRDDYEEAYSIVNLSPKASATLSRRCLQGMIRDFWNIKKSKLADAINELQNKVTSSQWKAIDSVRKIGNIGAHMESDINTIVEVDSGEAEKLLKLIELLIDKWYITRHDEEQLFLEISNIADNKMSQKKSSNQ
jgi:hypothetical protein|nr:MAG TPA: protein of unknown function (DUF4145) [Caudoviricetes sp.]